MHAAQFIVWNVPENICPRREWTNAKEQDLHVSLERWQMDELLQKPTLSCLAGRVLSVYACNFKHATTPIKVL